MNQMAVSRKAVTAGIRAESEAPRVCCNRRILRRGASWWTSSYTIPGVGFDVDVPAIDTGERTPY